MKKKYILNKEKISPKSSKIDQYRDFDRLMQAYKAPLSWGNLLIRWFSSGALFLILTMLSVSSKHNEGQFKVQNHKSDLFALRASSSGSTSTAQVSLQEVDELRQLRLQKEIKALKAKKQGELSIKANPSETSGANPKMSLSDVPERNLTDDTLSKPQAYEQAEPLSDYPTLYQFLAENLRYPEEALKDSIEGTVKVRFLISPKGNITEAEVIQSLSNAHDQEAQRVILMMPPWKPARLNGKAVPSRIVIPLTFKINKNK